MQIGVPRELKDHEYRVGLTPLSVAELVKHGHRVDVENGAGLGAGITDEAYLTAGATIAAHADEVWEESELIVKVKEPLAAERTKLSPGQVLFTFLHLAPDPDQTSGLIASGATCIAYETVSSSTGGLPLLAPMSEVAGRLAPQAGAHCLERQCGGRGVLLGGVPGVPPGNVVILGGGVSGTHAATIAIGMNANVTIVDRSPDVLRRAAAQFGKAVQTVFSTSTAIEELVKTADLVVGCVLVPGAAAPKLITREMVASMRPGAVIVDVAIDQGGCSETSRKTTHSEPVYIIDHVVHYCVTNMPAAVARTSTYALNNVTLPFVMALADKGWRQAMLDDLYLRAGLNVHAGMVTCEPVAAAQGLKYTPVVEALAA
jgi:alanine dehydrogenase